MCGLYGWILTEGAPRPLAYSLAALNAQRGAMSWGFWTPTGVRKGLGHAAQSGDSWATPAGPRKAR
jgi:hypothetical protein